MNENPRSCNKYSGFDNLNHNQNNSNNLEYI